MSSTESLECTPPSPLYSSRDCYSSSNKKSDNKIDLLGGYSPPESPTSGEVDYYQESKEVVHPSVYGFPLKYVALLCLVVQTVAVVLTLRWSRMMSSSSSSSSASSNEVVVRYLNTSAVTASEVVKLISCIGIVWYENGYSIKNTIKTLHVEVIGKPMETLKVGFPAFLYTIQNNLIFISLSNLSGAMYQVTYQLKILTTALLSVLLLNRRLGWTKWSALFLLTLGVIFIQLPVDGRRESDRTTSSTSSSNTFVGLVAVLAACCTSGLAGVYFEMILKQNTKTTIWMRNIQLAIYGSILGALGAYWNDYDRIVYGGGFFQGYTLLVWVVVLLQAVGGLIVAAVLKYADNILKCFGNALSIILSCLFSYYFLSDFTPTYLFAFGTLLVIAATYIYGTTDPFTSLATFLRLQFLLSKKRYDPKKTIFNLTVVWQGWLPI